jgi:hypothetical protein
MARLVSAFSASKASDQSANLHLRDDFKAAGSNHMVGTGAFDMIGNLQLADLPEFLPRHAGAGKHPFALHPQGCRNHNDRISLIDAAFFKQKGDVKDDHRPGPVALEELLPGSVNRRMDDMFKRTQFIRLAKNGSAQGLAVDAVLTGGAGKARLDCSDKNPIRALQPVDFGISVEHRDTLLDKHFRYG